MHHRSFSLFALLLSAVSIACTPYGPDLALPESIDLCGMEEIVLANGLSETFEFTVSPADAVFNHDPESSDCQIRLEYDNPADPGRSPSYYSLSSVTSEGDGRYSAVIKDWGYDKKYDDEVLLRINVNDKDVCSPSFRVRYEKEPLFTTISFLKEHNQTAVYQDFTVDVTQVEPALTSPLVSSPMLVASFDSNGAKVYVDGVEQVSGVTVNDFSKPVTYEVKSKVEYSFTVKVVYSGLPVLFVETPGGREVPSKWEDWMTGTSFKLYNPDWTVNHECMTGMRGRGNSTWSYPKKPYAFKFEEKAQVLGMPKHKRWVLLANWMDRTLLRNAVSFNLASRTGLAYTPRGQFVEVYLNGEHKGNYLLCEHIKVDKNRVDIDELDEGETDGGYIMELDSYFDEVNKFRSSWKNLPYMFKDPDEVDSSQFEFIRSYVNNLEASLYDGNRFEKGEYRDYIDVDSFIDWWMVMELTGIWEPNHPKSCYMHKDKGGKLTMGPVWDFDWETYMPMNWFRIKDALYYDRLFQDPYFKAKVKERWNMFESEFRALPEFIASEAERIRGSESMNHVLWPITQVVNKDEHMSFEDAVESMIDAYNAKLEWMDNEIGKM